MEKMVKAFEDHNVEVVSMTPAEYQAWIEVAKKSSYARFAKEVPTVKAHRRGAGGQVIASAGRGRRENLAGRISSACRQGGNFHGIVLRVVTRISWFATSSRR